MPNYGQYTDTTWKGRFNYRQINFLKRNFHKSDGYCTVTWYKNDSTEASDIPTHIFNSGLDAKGIKSFACHPDNNFEQGDIIDYIDGYKYIITKKDVHESVQAYGKLTRAQDSISWKLSDGTVKTHHYALESSGIGGQDESDKFPLSEAKKVLWMQRNSDTLSIYENQRFIMWNKYAYKCTNIDLSEIGIVKVILEKDVIQPEDDLINNIAYNGDVTSPQPTPTTEVQFSTSSLEIPVGLSDTVSVYEYISGVAQPTTFTFRIDGIDASKYSILYTTGNSIEIEADEFYYTGQLVAIKDVTLEETSIPLILKSLF